MRKKLCKKKCILDFGGKPKGQIPLGKPRKSRSTSKDNIKMDLQEIGWDKVEWIWFMIGASSGLL